MNLWLGKMWNKFLGVFDIAPGAVILGLSVAFVLGFVLGKAL